MATANAFLDDFEAQKTYLKCLQKHRKRGKINKAKVLPEKQTRNNRFAKLSTGIWRNF